MATKIGKGVTNYEGFPPIKLHDPLLTWFVRWRDKLKSLYSPPQCLWSQSLAGWWLMSIQSVGLARSRDKLKSLYIYYHNAYGYQTWLGWDMQLGFSFLKITKPCDYIFLQGHVKNWIRNIFTSTMLMATQLAGWGYTMWSFFP